MKKLMFFVLTAAALMVTVAGCSNILEAPQQKEYAGLSGVEVSIGGGARTLLPGVDLLYYTLAFTGEGKEPVNRTLNGADSLSVPLEPGTWTLNVTGYLNAEEAGAGTNALAEGSAAVTVSAGRSTPVRVELRAIEEASGTGTLNYTVNFPDQVEKAALKLVPITGAGNTQTITVKNDSTVNKSGSQDGLAAGYYRIILELSYYDAEAGLTKRAEKSQVAHIYAGMETDLTETFGEDAFSSTPTFTTLEALETYLAGTAPNTRTEPYHLILKDFDLSTDFINKGGDPLGKLFSVLNGRFVSLDLSACTGDFIDGPFLISRNPLVALVLPPSVTRIGDYLFTSATWLGSVAWPRSEGEAVIGANAFSYCFSLTQVILPPTLKTIGTYAFSYCSSLSSLDLPGTLESISNYAFLECRALESVNWPLSLAEAPKLGDSAFGVCQRLRTVILPPTLAAIGSSAFASCTSLESINLPPALTSIGNYAFSSCAALVSVDVPAGVTGQNLGIGAFSGCTSLRSVTLPEGLTWLYTNTFSGSLLETITLPASLTVMNGTPFANCTKLTYFTVAEGNTTFSTGANGMVLLRYYNDELSTYLAPGASGDITIPEGVTVISSGAFQGNVSLTGITLPSTLITINENAFSGCSALREITIPPSVDTIAYNVFEGCSSLESFSWPEFTGEGTPAWGSTNFRNCTSLENVTLPDGLAGIPFNTFQGCTSLASIDLPDSVTSIGGYAFQGCDSLESITLPSGVTTINTYAFQNCSSLGSITLPAKITAIGNYSFDGCGDLESITMLGNVASIGNYAFRGCGSLESITLPETVRTIGTYAFQNCSSLGSITLPAEVTAISNYSFDGDRKSVV
jgi:hypothetical protein